MKTKVLEEKELKASQIFIQQDEQLRKNIKKYEGKADGYAFYFLFFVLLSVAVFFLFKTEFIYFLLLMLIQ